MFRRKSRSTEKNKKNNILNSTEEFTHDDKTHDLHCHTVSSAGDERWDTHAALKYVRNQSWNLLDMLACNNRPAFLCLDSNEKIIQMDEAICGDIENWYIIGDIHGDFFALHRCIEHIRTASQDFRILFLGDLVDRGPFSLECIWYLLDVARKYPDRILWLAGNHDLGLCFDEVQGRFSSTVIPAEFVSQLNGELDGWLPARQWIGKQLIRLFANLPRAVLFPDGLLATHGGFPHIDLHPENITEMNLSEQKSWLNSDHCLQDFTWSRICRYPRRLPNRNRLGHTYGYEDFEDFRRLVADFFPVQRLITGHEHPSEGYDTHESWEGRALTLTGFGFGMDYENRRAFYEGYREYLVLGHCRPGEIPRIVKIPVDREELFAFHSSQILFASQPEEENHASTQC